MQELKCQYCGKNYYRKNAKQKYCCIKCSDKASKKIECVCQHCGIIFYANKSMIANGRGKYCSHKCAGLSVSTKIMVECKVCGKQYYARPDKLSKGEQKCCSLKCRNVLLTGSNNPAWKGGITPKIRLLRKNKDMQNWRTEVFRRDGYTCVKCGEKKNLNAHHIIPFSCDESLRFELSNGITLCEKCHKLEHKRLKKIRKDNYDLFTS